MTISMTTSRNPSATTMGFHPLVHAVVVVRNALVHSMTSVSLYNQVVSGLPVSGCLPIDANAKTLARPTAA